MSIMGEMHSDDSAYCFSVRGVLQRLSLWLKDPSLDDQPVIAFERILQAMAAEMPFEPPRHTGRPSPLFTAEPFTYRRPAWGAIAAAVDKAKDGEKLESLEEKANWLLGQLETSYRLREFEKECAKFSKSLERLKFSPSDVVVTGEFQKKGEVAVKLVTELVDALLPAIDQIWKEQSARVNQRRA